MQLTRLHLHNFRCFSDEVFELCNYTALVGQNNAERALTELLLENKSFPCLEECVAKLESFWKA